MIIECFYLKLKDGKSIFIKVESDSGAWIENREAILDSLEEHGEIRKE